MKLRLDRLAARLGLLVVAAVGALSLSAGPAQAWTSPDAYVFAGGLTSTLGVPGTPSLTCDPISFNATLDSGSANSGTVETSTPNPSGCTATTPNCTVDVTFPYLPWTIAGTNSGGGSGPVTISNSSALFDVEYSGPLCGLAGTKFEVGGSVTGDYDATSGCLTFNAAAGLAVDPISGPIPPNTSVALDGTVCVVGDVIPELE